MLLALFILLPILLAAGVGGLIVRPYVTGAKQIDKGRYPTLARAQRIYYVNNTKKREREYSSAQLAIEQAAKIQERDISNQQIKSQNAIKIKHQNQTTAWMADFKAITAAEDARIEAKRQKRIAAKAEAKRQAEAEQAQIAYEARQKELAEWTEREKKRIAEYTQQRNLEMEEENRLRLIRDEVREMQAELRSAFKVDDPSSGTRVVSVPSVFIRSFPSRKGKVLHTASSGSIISVRGWIVGESLYGNNIWYRLSKDGWIWSGAFDNVSFGDLKDMNFMKESGDTIVSKSANGYTVNSYTAPSPLESYAIGLETKKSLTKWD